MTGLQRQDEVSVSLRQEHRTDSLRLGVATDPAPGRFQEMQRTRLPAGTSVRFLVLVLMVLGTSVSLFQMLYLVAGRSSGPTNLVRWTTTLAQCEAARKAEAPAAWSTDADTRADQLNHMQGVFNACLAPARTERVLWIAGAVALMLGFAVVIYLLSARWTIWRRGLVALSVSENPDLVRRLDDLWRASGSGCRRAPVWMLNPSAPGPDGQAFGLPGRRRIWLAIPLVSWYSAGIGPGGDPECLARFDAAVLHELAHLRNRDVDMSSFAVAVFWAYVVVALAPFLGYLLHPNLLWRPLHWMAPEPITLHWVPALIVFPVLARFLRNAILRVRELEANATAASCGDDIRDQLLHLFAPGSAGQVHGWRLWLTLRPWRDHHPRGERQLAAIRCDGSVLQPRPWETAAAGASVAMLATAMHPVMSDIFPRNMVLPALVNGTVAGALLSAVLTVVVWRATAGLPAGQLPVRTWLVPPMTLVVGFLVGEPLTPISAVTGLDEFRKQWSTVESVLFAVLPLLAGAVLVSGWASSLGRHLDRPARQRWQVTALALAAVVAVAPWFASWLSGHHEHLYLGFCEDSPIPDGGRSWYAGLGCLARMHTLPTDDVFNHPLLLLGPLLLGAVPVVAAYRSADGERVRVEVRRALRAALLGTGIGLVLDVVIPLAFVMALPQGIRYAADEAGFRPVFWATWSAVTTVVVVAVACLVVVRATCLRPAMAMVALSLSAVLGTLCEYVYYFSARWFDVYSTTHVGRVPYLSPYELSRDLRTVLSHALVLAVPVAAAAFAGQALIRRRTVRPAQISIPVESFTPSVHPRRFPCRTPVIAVLVLLGAAVLVETLVGLPDTYTAWFVWASPR